MIDSALSLSHTKVNFLLAKFAYPITWAVEPTTRVQTMNRLQLAPPMVAKEVLDKVSIMYYVVLNTGFETKSDFTIGLWYPNEEDTTKYVESFLLTLKRKNNPTNLQLQEIYRAKISEVSLTRMYPNLPANPLKRPGEALTSGELQALRSDRQQAGFMLKSYLATFELKFKSEWFELSEAKQKGLLKDLDNFAEKMFPGRISSILLDTPMQDNCDSLYVAFLDKYVDFSDFMLFLKNLDIAFFIEDNFGKLTICNHTTREVLESPQNMISRS